MRSVDGQLLIAADNGNEDGVKKSIEEGANVNVFGWRDWKRTPLHLAATKGSEPCCRLLLQAKADVNIADSNGYTPLHLAANAGSEPCCRLLLQAKAVVNLNDSIERTPLHLAAGIGSEPCCSLLLQAKADVNLADSNGYTPLHYSAVEGSEPCCSLLLQAKADVNLATSLVSMGRTPLHFAILKGSEPCCRLLLQAKADVNLADSSEDTPLHYACHNQYITAAALLIDARADASKKNREGKTPLDLVHDFVQRLNLQKRLHEIKLYDQLIADGGRPVDAIKVFLCGDPNVGKSTIKNSLTKKLLSIIRSGLSIRTVNETDHDNADYNRTPGINVRKESVRGAGEFVFWDCAGHSEYSITHGMFLGASQSIFVVVYDMQQLLPSLSSVRSYWLPFIKAVRRSNELPRVVLVGTHVDKIPDLAQGERAARDFLRQATRMFDGTLDIDNSVILLNAKDDSCEGMKALKEILKNRRDDIRKNVQIPKICHEMQTLIKPWREEVIPVISWPNYLQRVQTKYPHMDDRGLKRVTTYLHMMGEVYLAEFAEKESQIILNTQWFTTNIIGAAFAGSDFAAQFQTLPNKPYYKLQELQDFFPGKMDTVQLLALLDHMDLVHTTEDNRYLIPGKLPTDEPAIDWDAQHAFDIKGKCLECASDTDIFNPNVFPCVLKKILDNHRGYAQVSRSAVKFSKGSIKVFVKLTKHKRSIRIATMCPDKDSRGECYKRLQEVVNLIKFEILERSPGTSIQENYISHRSIKVSRDLEDVVTFNEDDLTRAEAESGSIDNQGEPEKVTDILFQGHDCTLLRKFGAECRYEWLPQCAVTCIERLDTIDDKWEEDYRAVGKALSIQNHVVKQIAEESRETMESTTNNIIKKWCKQHNRKMTIVMLQTLLRRLSLVANKDVLDAVDEVLAKYSIELPVEKVDSASKLQPKTEDFTGSATEHLAAWRTALKRHWPKLRANLDPKEMMQHLKCLPEDVCKLFRTRADDPKQSLKDASTLLQLLLKTEDEDWPADLLDGLFNSGQMSLAQILLDELQTLDYDGSLIKQPYLQGVRKKRQEAATITSDPKTEPGVSFVPTFPTDEIKESDFGDVVRVLGPDDLQRLYRGLGLKDYEVEKAEKEADTKAVDLIGRKVLVLWRKKNGQAATRQAIINAMDGCDRTQAKGEVIQRWNIKYSKT